MKKFAILTSLCSVLAGVLFSSCASDKPTTTQTTTTQRETVVTQPATTKTTTTRTSGY